MPILVNFLGRNQFENMVAVNLLKPSYVYTLYYLDNPKMVSLEQKYYKLHNPESIETLYYDFQDIEKKDQLIRKFLSLSKENKIILNIANPNQRYFSFIHELLAMAENIDYCFIKDNQLYYYTKKDNAYSMEIRDCTDIVENTEIETFFGIYDKTLTYDLDVDNTKLSIVRGLASIDPSLHILERMKTSESKHGNYSKYRLDKYDDKFKSHLNDILKENRVGYVESGYMYILSSWENFFKGMWLEFLLYDILTKDNELSNLYRNVKIRDSDGYDNELDIVCTYKGRLKLISCKTVKSDSPKDINTKLTKYLEDIHSRRDSIHMDVQSFIAVALTQKDIPDGIRARANDDKIGIITVEEFQNIAEIIKR